MRVKPIWIAPVFACAALAAMAAVPLDLGYFQGAAEQKEAAVQTNRALVKKVTKRFVNADLADVLAWLSLERLSFVAEVDAFPNRRVTLNFVNQPLERVLDVIADTFGGTWEQKGDIWTLRSPDSRFGRAMLAPEIRVERPEVALALPRFEATPELRATTIAPAAIERINIAQEQEPEKKLSPEQRAQIEKAIAQAREALSRALSEIKSQRGKPGMPERAQLEEMLRQIQETLGRTIPRALEGLPMAPGKLGEPFRFEYKELNPEDMKKFQENAKLFEKGFAEKFQKMSPEDMKRFEEHSKLFAKAFAEKAKGLQDKDLDVKVFSDPEQMKKFQERFKMLDKEKFQMLDKEKMKMLDKEMLEKMKAMPDMKLYGDLGQFKLERAPMAFAFGGGTNVEGLLDSLTAEQQAKMKRTGHLTPSDLNDKQRALLGKMPEGKWEITFVRNGKKVTIKSGS